MLNAIRTKVDKTKQFVKKNQTALACTATAVVSVAVTRKIDIRIARQFAYDKGYEMGLVSRDLDAYSKFIDKKDLIEEFNIFQSTLEFV